MRSVLFLLIAMSLVMSIEIQPSVDNGAAFNPDQEQEMEASQEKHEFQAEVGRLMDIIINSLYSQKEVFIRELISNAADALDKIRFEALSDASVLESSEKELEIRVEYDNTQKTISFEDNGVGMTKEDLKENLGTVAKSGTTQFIEAIKGGNLNLIGQFGVGFYASFLAANKVQVWSKHNQDEQYVWESQAANEFTLTKDPRGNTLGRGTRVVLFLKEEAYDLLQEGTLKGYIKKYSEYINFPIKLRTLKTTQKEVPVEEEEKSEEEEKKDDLEVKDEEEQKKPKTQTITEERWEDELQNSNKAIWTRSAEDIEESEYNKFYRSLSQTEEDPACYTHFKTDGGVEFRSILFAPKKAPAGLMENYYQAKSSAISLYVRRVLISDSFDDLMPKYLAFISGVIDSDDLPLNVNREQLQQSKMLKQISRKLVKKSIDMMLDLAKGDEDEDEEEEEKEEKEENKAEKKVNTKYLEFFKENGRFLKMGIMEDQANKHKLAKLLRYTSTHEYSKTGSNTMTSLEEYISRMKEDQKEIYFLGGENMNDIYSSPIIKKILKAGYEILMLDETIDEFVFQHLDTFEEKKLLNVGKGSFTLPNQNAEDEKKKMKKLNKHYKPLSDYWQKQFEQLQSVQVSSRLVDEPVVIVTSEYGTSATMEKLQKAQAYGMNKEQQNMQAQFNKKVLEINPNHPLIKSLLSKVTEVKAADPEGNLSADMIDLLHLLTHGALIHSGYSLENPLDFQARLFRQANVLAGVSQDDQLEEVEIDWEEEEESPEEKDPIAEAANEMTEEQIIEPVEQVDQDKDDL